MSATRRRLLAQGGRSLEQASTGGVFHAENGSPFALTDFVDRQNVGMIETGGGFGFAAEARQRLARIGVMAEDAFERDDTTGMALPGAINHPMPPRPISSRT
jgi:hypothetical protein